VNLDRITEGCQWSRSHILPTGCDYGNCLVSSLLEFSFILPVGRGQVSIGRDLSNECTSVRDTRSLAYEICLPVMAKWLPFKFLAAKGTHGRTELGLIMF